MAELETNPTLTPAQIEAISELTLGGGTARMRRTGDVDVRTCSLSHQLEYLITVTGERILAQSTARSARRRLGSWLALVGSVLFVPATLLAIPLTIIAAVGVLPHPALWLFVIPTAGWVLAAAGLSLGNDEDFLVSGGRRWHFQGALPLDEWVEVTRTGEDEDES